MAYNRGQQQNPFLSPWSPSSSGATTTPIQPPAPNGLQHQVPPHHLTGNLSTSTITPSPSPSSTTSSISTASTSSLTTVSSSPSTTTTSSTTSTTSSFSKAFSMNVGRFSFGKSGIGVRNFVTPGLQSFLSSMSSFYSSSTTNVSQHGTPQRNRNNNNNPANPSGPTTIMSPSGNSTNCNLDASQAENFDVLQMEMNRVLNTQCLSPRPRPRHLNLNIQNNGNFQYGAPGSRSMGMGPQRRQPPNLNQLVFPGHNRDLNQSQSSSQSGPCVSSNIPPPIPLRRSGPSPSGANDPVRLSTQFPTKSLLTIDGKVGAL